MKPINTLILAGIAVAMVGCTTTADNTAILSLKENPVTASKSTPQYLPKVRVYKTNIPVNNHPAVRVSNSGQELVYYPDPRDIHENSRPVELAGGWYLDRQGAIGDGTRFLTYTFEEYAALPTVPKASELLESLQKEACVTAIRTLDITPQEAIADTAAVNALLRSAVPIPKPNPNL